MKELLVVVALAACGGSKSSSSSHARTYKMSDLPAATWLDGLPASGTGTVTVDLSDDPGAVKDWSKVTGTIDAACGDCRIGDDQTPLEVHGRGGFGGKLSFSHVAWDSLTAHADFEGGTFHMIGHARGDLDLDLDLKATLAPSLHDSSVDGCVAFRPTDRLRGRDEKLYDSMQLVGAPRGGDGRFFIGLRGTFGNLRRIPTVCEVAAR